MSFLRSNELLLRSVEPADLPFLLAIENDAASWRHSENYMPFSSAVLDQYVKGEHDLVKHGQYRFMIHDSVRSVPVGCVDLFNYSPIHSRAGVGIYISEGFRNKGRAKVALELLCTYAKEILNLELIYCSVLSSNSKSLKLFKSVFFEETGKRVKWSKQNGVREDVILLQRLL